MSIEKSRQLFNSGEVWTSSETDLEETSTSQKIDHLAFDSIMRMVSFESNVSELDQKFTTSDTDSIPYHPYGKPIEAPPHATRKKTRIVFQLIIGFPKNIAFWKRKRTLPTPDFTKKTADDVADELIHNLDHLTYRELRELYEDLQDIEDEMPELVSLREFVEVICSVPQIYYDSVVINTEIPSSEKGRFIASVFAELHSMNMNLLNQSFDTIDIGLDRFLENFMNYLIENSPEKCVTFLKSRVNYEVTNAKNQETCLRKDSIFSKSMKVFLHSTCMEYAQNVLSPVTEMAASWGSLEVDPDKLDTEDKYMIEPNQVELIHLTMMMIEGAANQLDAMTVEAKEVIKEVYEAALEKFDDEEFAQIQVASQLFLRFLNPLLITQPGTTSELRRGLILIAKLTQNVANQTNAEGKGVGKEKYLEFAYESAEVLNELMEQLTGRLLRD